MHVKWIELRAVEFEELHAPVILPLRPLKHSLAADEISSFGFNQVIQSCFEWRARGAVETRFCPCDLRLRLLADRFGVSGKVTLD